MEWREEFAQLSNALSPDHYAKARRSTQDAHYTPVAVIDGIYKGLERLGFTGGQVLDAGAGTGHFIGAMPESMRAATKYTAIEVDPVTAAIGQKLYPRAAYKNKGYEQFHIPSGHFDAVVGNPPYGPQSLYDANHRELAHFSIHNYFIAKSIDKLRPGGVLAVVVSRYFMDAQNPTAREHIADRAHLLGAIRLPNTVFKENALTEVTTDIVFFQRAREGEVTNKRWLEIEPIPNYESNDEIRVNRYFVDHPEQMLGTMTLVRSMHGDKPELLPLLSGELATQLERAVRALPANAYLPAAKVENDVDVVQSLETLSIPEQIKIGSYFITPTGQIARRLPDLIDQHDYVIAEARNARAAERIRGMIGIRDALRSVMRAELHDIIQPAPDAMAGETMAVAVERLDGTDNIEGEDYVEILDGDQHVRAYRADHWPHADLGNLWKVTQDAEPGAPMATYQERGNAVQIVPETVHDQSNFTYYRAQFADGSPIGSFSSATTAARAGERALQLRRTTDLDGLRTELNSRYDKFIAKHGHLSSQANRLAMNDDPEYALLFALEKDYDKGPSPALALKQGVPAREPSAKKAAIFQRRVLSPRREIVSAESAKDGLVISMNERGRVDLDYIVRLCRTSEEDVLKQLAGRIFRDPVKQQWVTADQYLSGNVKVKLAEAIHQAENDPQYQANVDALRGVQPIDIDAVDIAVSLGSTWIPSDVVSEFVKHLLGNVRAQIRYTEALGKWHAKISDPDYTVNHVTWGTGRYPASDLIEAILQQRPIQVKDEVGRTEAGAPIYQQNADETTSANQKADEIRQAFLDWLWTDKDRRQQLEKLYNDRFNTNVAPTYDGSHLAMHGASVAISFRPHQKDAVWRGIQEGSTLFDHAVGAGKTFVAVATVMESKRMGLYSKPMLVVPNHLLLQWKDAFYELYPNANILVADKTDFSKENREKLFARIATNDWDAVIVAHSSFKKIGIPPATLETILTEQIDDLTDSILAMKAEKGDKITIKEMERAKERMEERMKRSADTGAKDKSLTFDELGVDSLVVDEAHLFKNLQIVTGMSRVSGLGNLAGSDMAFDLFAKCRYLQMKQEGRGVYFATGTPISNTIAELYTQQRYLRYDDMRARGIAHFDAWASTFGQVVTGWELDATGVNYRLNSRFAKFQNVPELVSMYRTFADVITKTDLDRQAAERGTRFPVPKIKTGKPINVVVERSPEQAKFMGIQERVRDQDGNPMRRANGSEVREWNKGSIIWRMEHLPNDPRIDNPLKITNEARKAGLDFRLIDPNAADHPGSKVNACVNNLIDIYNEWKDKKGTQMVFSDLSTPKGGVFNQTPDLDAGDDEDDAPKESFSMDELLAESGPFSVYDDIKRKLIERNIPADEIRFIHDAKTDAQKDKLFYDMNEGNVRVLIGSTAKMGAGTNAQRRLVAIHHLDAPWRPSDLEQRDGRGVRQGNALYEADPDGFEFTIMRYATKSTYDSRMWQTIEYKASGIEQFRRGDALMRTIEDVAGEAANAAEMKAAATGNVLIFMQVKLAADLKKAEAIYSNHVRNQHFLEKRIEYLGQADTRAEQSMRRWKGEQSIRDAYPLKENIPFVLPNGKRLGDDQRKELLDHLIDRMKEALDHRAVNKKDEVEVGQYRGFTIYVHANGHDFSQSLNFTITGKTDYQSDNFSYRKNENISASGFITRIDNYLASFESRMQEVIGKRDAELTELDEARHEALKPFAQMQRLEDLRADNRDVMAELQRMQASDSYESTWQPRTIEQPQPPVSASQTPAAQPRMASMG
jgi:N12 class adenine-specific DNA methylase/predicted RNA methylase